MVGTDTAVRRGAEAESVVGQSSRRRRLTLVAASLGFAVIQLDVFVVNVAVKQIGTALGGGTSSLQWVVGAYTLMFAALILTAGALGDRFGARRMYSLGFVVFVLASIACGLAPDMVVLVIARGFQGIGAALLGSCSLALLNHTFRGDQQRTKAIGVWAAGASVALSAGPVVGGALIATLGWRAIFFINLPVGALGLFLTRRFADETTPGHRRIDLPGQLAAVVTMGALAGALIEGGAVGFSSAFVVGALVVAVVGATIFFGLESGSTEPMLPLALFRRGAFAGPALLGLVINVAFYGLIFVFSLFFQREQGFSALGTGLAFLPLTGVVLASNLAARPLGAAIGTRAVILVGLTAMAVGCAGLLTVGRSTPLDQMVVQQILMGGGIGLVVPPMTSALMGSVDRTRSGIAAGTLNTTRQFGSVLGVAVFGTLVASRGSFIVGFHVALAMSIVLVGIGMLLTRAIAAPSETADD
jgi:DHA2 family methylenomycin A resistance protein-like MFS transporter